MYLHATGNFEPPRYPTVPIIVNEYPDREAAESFRSDLAKLNKLSPTPFADMPRYRLVEGWNRIRFWCGYDTSRYPDKIIKKHVGWLIHLKDKKGKPLYDKAGEPEFFQLPLNLEEWPSWAEKYKGSDTIKIPDMYFFTVGRMAYIVEEWLSPEVACKNWERNRYAIHLTDGSRLDVMGEPPRKGDYTPVLVITDEQGRYETPTKWHFEIVESAHKLREKLGKDNERPGGETTDEALGRTMRAYQEALYKQVEKDEEEFAEYAMERYNRVAHKLNEMTKPQFTVPSNYGELSSTEAQPHE